MGIRRTTGVIAAFVLLAGGAVASAASGSAAVTRTALSANGIGAQLPGTYQAVDPARVLDTGSGVGTPRATVPAHGSVTVHLLGAGGIPATGVGAVALTATAASPSAGGYLTVYPAGTSRPTVSTLNFSAGRTVANLVVVKVGAGGAVTFYNGSAGTVRLVADVHGYVLAGSVSAPGGYVGVAPARIVDTATGIGVPSGPLGAGRYVGLDVRGRGGMPTSGIGAVLVNVTAASPSATGSISVMTTDGGPRAQNVTFAPGQNIANLVLVQVSSTGHISFWNNSPGTVRIVADVEGYVRSGAGTAAGAFNSMLNPFPAVDMTQSVRGVLDPPLAAQTAYPQGMAVGDNGRLPGTGVGVAIVSVTVTDTKSSGYLTGYADGTTRPGTSDLNFSAGSTVTGLMFVRVSPKERIQIYNGSAGSVRLIIQILGYANTTDSPSLPWSPVLVNPPRGGILAMSCPTATTCVAVDQFGNAVVGTSGSWSRPVKVTPLPLPLISVSCPTTSFCVAVGPTFASVYDGSHWAAPVPIETNPLGIVLSVSCPTTTFCVAVDNLGQAITFNGTSWKVPVAVDPIAFAAVSCGAAGSCAATDHAGGIAVLSGSAWHVTPAVFDSFNDSLAVSCPTASYCLAATEAEVASYNGSTWSTSPLAIPGQGFRVQVSCASPTYCALSSQGLDRFWTATDGRTWTAQPGSAFATTAAVDCVTVGRCIVAGTPNVDAPAVAVETLVGSAWQPPVSADYFDPGALDAVQCPSTTYCLAVTGSGYVEMHGSTWAYPVQLDKIGALSCPSVTFCMTVTGDNFWRRYDGSTWSAALNVPKAKGVRWMSCASSSYCLAIDGTGQAFRYDGRRWTLMTGSPAGLAGPISCAAPTFCMAKSTYYSLIELNGSTWSAPISPHLNSATSAPVAIFCVSSSDCTVTGQDGEASHLGPNGWLGPQPFDLFDTTTAMSCVSPGTCQTVDDLGNVVPLVNGIGGVPTRLDVTHGLTAISCATATFCVAVDQTGFAFVNRVNP